MTEDPAKRQKSSRKHYEKHRERLIEMARARRKADPEKHRAQRLARIARMTPEEVARRKAYEKAWYDENVGRHARVVKALSLRKRYGLTIEQFEAMHAAQDSRCAVCGDEYRPLHVDHCHETGVVRGLLCFRCNSTAGKFGDDPVLLQKLVAYLEKAWVAKVLS